MKFIVKNGLEDANEQWQWLSKHLPRPKKWGFYIIKIVDDEYYWEVTIHDEQIALLFLLIWGDKVYAEKVSRFYETSK